MISSRNGDVGDWWFSVVFGFYSVLDSYRRIFLLHRSFSSRDFSTHIFIALFLVIIIDQQDQHDTDSHNFETEILQIPIMDLHTLIKNLEYVDMVTAMAAACSTLMVHGMDFTKPDNDGYTPLQLLTMYLANVPVDTAVAVAVMLFTGGADPKMRDDRGYAPLDYLAANLPNVGSETASVIASMLIEYFPCSWDVELIPKRKICTGTHRSIV